MSKNTNDNEVNAEKKESFLEKMKSDNTYNAKVQLIGYGVFIVILVVYLNLANMGNNSDSLSNNTVFGNITGNDSVENTSEEDTDLLEKIGINYSYDVVIRLDKKSMNTETNEEVNVEHSIHYLGRAYGTKLEINKIVGDVTELYYKIDDSYYSKVDNITTLVKESIVYDIVDKEYIELDSILELMNKASLDYVTNYSSGKKESVYHLQVKDIINYQSDDVIEIGVVEENDTLEIKIDYSNLFKVIDESIAECELEFIITDVGKVEDFSWQVSKEESTYTE